NFTKLAGWKKIALGMLLLLIPSLGAWCINGMISGLVQNSDISFDVNNIFGLSAYSYLGLFLIALLLSAFFLIADRCVRIFQQLIERPATRWYLLLAGTVLYTGLLHLSGFVDLLAVLWPFEIFFLLLAWRRNAVDLTYSFSLIVFLVFVFSFYTTHMLIKQGMHKEHDSRVLFAEKLAQEEDPIGENLFTEFEMKLAHDSELIAQSQFPNLDMNAFDNRVKQQYFSGYWDKYDVKVSFFDTMCTPLLRANSPYSEN